MTFIYGELGEEGMSSRSLTAFGLSLLFSLIDPDSRVPSCSLVSFWAFKSRRDDWERAEIQAAEKPNAHAYNTT